MLTKLRLSVKVLDHLCVSKVEMSPGEKEKILMGQKKLQRWHLMKMVQVGKITLREASKKIDVSYRQAKRIKRTLRVKGIKGILHGNTGCIPIQGPR